MRTLLVLKKFHFIMHLLRLSIINSFSNCYYEKKATMFLLFEPMRPCGSMLLLLLLPYSLLWLSSMHAFILRRGLRGGGAKRSRYLLPFQLQQSPLSSARTFKIITFISFVTVKVCGCVCRDCWMLWEGRTAGGRKSVLEELGRGGTQGAGSDVVARP